MATVLLVDDEVNVRKVLAAMLQQEGHETVLASNGHQALIRLAQGDIDVLITDLRMPGMSGLDLLREVHEKDPELPVIVITAHGSVETAVVALKNGAFDYITKPFEKHDLATAVRKAAGVRQAEDAQAPIGNKTNRRLVGNSDAIRHLHDVLDRVANTPSTVLISGESGTGKELVATALHYGSNRCNKAFIKVNCAAIPKDLLESEFFGHEEGAFTGAINSKPGRFELADGGTLFLDEIGEIPLSTQVKLLRALQESEFERVGGIKTIHVDIRVVAATNRNLIAEVAKGNFREDLFYRLNVVPIHLPPLRERREDIAELAQLFVDKYNARLNRSIRGIDAKALVKLSDYSWPGNIRELENVIERTLLFTDGDMITQDNLPAEIAMPQSEPSCILGTRKSETSTPMRDIVRAATEELEKDLIVRALEQTSGNVTRASHLLQISRKGLQNKMKELGLREPDPEN